MTFKMLSLWLAFWFKTKTPPFEIYTNTRRFSRIISLHVWSMVRNRAVNQHQPVNWIQYRQYCISVCFGASKRILIMTLFSWTTLSVSVGSPKTELIIKCYSITDITIGPTALMNVQGKYIHIKNNQKYKKATITDTFLYK